MTYRLLFVLACCTTSMVNANPDVTSREYKLMLDASQFSYNSEYSDVQDLIDDVETAVESALSRSVTGTPQLTKQRTVMFFDVQGSCDLNAAGYSFRERVDNNQSEVTLKFRSQDRYISDFEDVSSSTNGAETKLEADIGKSSEAPIKIVYGHSTKAPNTRTINKVDDIHAHFPEFENDYGWNDNTSLSLVGNLTVHERVYKDVFIDLGQHDAELSVTLWYNAAPTQSSSPIIAEVSFKYEDSSADYTRKVVNRALDAFSAMQGLTSWVDNNALTKTRFVYQYDNSFCN